MKLNNRGWGLGFLIIVGVFFLLLLILVSMRIRSLTHELKDSDSKNETSENTSSSGNLYVSLEEVLKKAGESYTMYHGSLVENTSDYFTVWFDTLKNEGFIESLPDPEGAGNCSGYVLIKNDYSVYPFIKCSNYESLNYYLWVD